jgi:succinate dehydrogenase / fumarate reductase, membrane anchor subunit
MSDMRTPLNKVRGLGSARSGTENFWRIRLTSIALAPLSLFILGWVLSLRGAGFAEVRSSLSQPLITLAVALFLIISLDHMRLGMKEIIEDYVHDEGNRLALLVLNTFFTVLIGVASVFALVKLAFGG